MSFPSQEVTKLQLDTTGQGCSGELSPLGTVDCVTLRVCLAGSLPLGASFLHDFSGVGS